jgi:anthranilate synthase component 2
MLGICLGHQALGEVFGGKISIATKIMHGKVSKLKHEQQGLFRDVTLDTDIMRYHSLIIEPDTLPEVFEVYGYADDEIMAIKHKEYPVYGLQFHPESIGTTEGQTMIDTFLEVVEDK